MRRRRLGWIGVDLGARAIKLAQVERVGTRLRLHRGVVLPRSEHALIEDEGTRSSLPSADELRTALTMRMGFKGRTAACVLPMHRADLRAMTIPDGPPAERRAMVASELGAIFGSAADDWNFDYWETQLLGNTEWQASENVNVLAVPRDWTEGLTDELSGAGLRCEAIDGLPLTLARAVDMVTEPEAMVAALDWGHNAATFCIICGGRAMFTRVLRDAGLSHLTSVVEKELGLLPGESRQLLAGYGFPDPAIDEPALKEIQETIITVATGALANLTEELKKTIAYLHLHRPQLAPHRMWLFGGGAAIHNVAGYLTDKVGISMQPWRLPEEHPDQTTDNTPPQMLASAIALSALAFAT